MSVSHDRRTRNGGRSLPRPRPGRITGRLTPAGSADQVGLRSDHAELVALGIGQDGPRLVAALTDVHAPRARGRRAAATSASRSAGVASAPGLRSRWTRFLTTLSSGDGMKQSPIGASSAGPTITSALALGQDRPAEGGAPEPGQRREVMGVDHDVVEGDGHGPCSLAVRRRPPRPDRRTASAVVPQGQRRQLLRREARRVGLLEVGERRAPAAVAGAIEQGDEDVAGVGVVEDARRRTGGAGIEVLGRRTSPT